MTIANAWTVQILLTKQEIPIYVYDGKYIITSIGFLYFKNNLKNLVTSFVSQIIKIYVKQRKRMSNRKIKEVKNTFASKTHKIKKTLVEWIP